jgi:hypothetical protein
MNVMSSRLAKAMTDEDGGFEADIFCNFNG